MLFNPSSGHIANNIRVVMEYKDSCLWQPCWQKITKPVRARLVVGPTPIPMIGGTPDVQAVNRDYAAVFD